MRILKNRFAIAVSICFVIGIMQSCNVDAAKISGNVIDATTGKPIPGLNVEIIDSGFKAVSDAEGKYSLDYVAGEFTVLYSKRGYFPKTLQLKIARKEAYPAADQYLRRQLVPIYWTGEPIADARVQVNAWSRDFGNRGSYGEADCDPGGFVELPFIKGLLRIGLSAPMTKPGGYLIEMETQNFPRETHFLMFPSTPGLYNGKDMLQPCVVRFEHSKGIPGSGPFGLPPLVGPHEGKYFVEGEPVVFSKDNLPEEFFWYSAAPASIMGRNPFATRRRFMILEVEADGLFLHNTHKDESICKQTAYESLPLSAQGGTTPFIHEEHTLFRIRPELKSGTYVFLDVSDEYAGNTFFPSKDSPAVCVRVEGI